MSWKTGIDTYTQWIPRVEWMGFPGSSVVKNLPAVQAGLISGWGSLGDIWVRISGWYLGEEDPLEREMATPSSTLAWRIPRTEEPGGIQSMGSQRVEHDWGMKHARIKQITDEPLRYSPGGLYSTLCDNLTEEGPKGRTCVRTCR